MKKILLIAGVFVFAAVMAHAAESTTEDGTAKAKIVDTLVLEHVDGAALNFGTLIKPAAAGSVTVDPDGNASYSGVQAVTTGGIAVSADHFTVQNDSNVAFSVSPIANITIKDENGSGANSMTVTGVTTNHTNGQAGTSFDVGGTLQVEALQAPGDYQGTYPVTITY